MVLHLATRIGHFIAVDGWSCFINQIKLLYRYFIVSNSVEIVIDFTSFRLFFC